VIEYSKNERERVKERREEEGIDRIIEEG
jgi:hypothetical protein